MLSAIEDNNVIIKEIEELIKSLEIEKMEDKLIKIVKDLKIEEDESICDERLLFNVNDRINYFLNRIMSVNKLTITENKILLNDIQQIQYNQIDKYDIKYMDINNDIYVVKLFYEKLCGKTFLTIDEINKCNRILDPVVLSDDNKRKIANELSIFIYYINARKKLESLINLCKKINYNYIKTN